MAHVQRHAKFYPRGYHPNREANAGPVVFRRRLDGAVELRDDKNKFISIVPGNIWASIVSNMSAEGETSFSFNIALAFHVGALEYDPNAAVHPTDVPPALDFNTESSPTFMVPGRYDEGINRPGS